MVGARRSAVRLAIASALALVASAASTETAIVDARDYRSFWLWAGVRPQPVLETAERVYLLQSEVVLRPDVHLVSRRPSIPHVRQAEVWLVVRTETLAWPEDVWLQLERTLATWSRAGNKVAGLQIDFDARTRHLADYAAFLKSLRARLPATYKLGITGLLDWSANGDSAGLNALAGTVDEAVLQVYQGRHTIPGYTAYLDRLDRMTVPFRIGLPQGGAWRPPPSLARLPLFRGYVVFLLNM